MLAIVKILLFHAHGFQLKGVLLALQAHLVLFEFGLVVDGLDGLEEVDFVLEVGVGLELLQFLGPVLCCDVEQLVGQVFVDLAQFLYRKQQEALPVYICLAVLLLHQRPLPPFIPLFAGQSQLFFQVGNLPIQLLHPALQQLILGRKLVLNILTIGHLHLQVINPIMKPQQVSRRIAIPDLFLHFYFMFPSCSSELLDSVQVGCVQLGQVQVLQH